MDANKLNFLTVVEAKLGRATAQYLQNKHQGGKNNEGGAVYEANFAVLKLAESIGLALILEEEGAISISAQVPGFVDDLVVQSEHTGIKESYQLKRSSNVSWSSGKHPLEQDFKFQYQIDVSVGVLYSTTLLTLSDKDRYLRLKESIPDAIQHHTGCVYFPDLRLNVALLQKEAIYKALSAICVFDDDDKLSRLHTILIGVWSNHRSQCTSVSDFMDKVWQINPHYLKGHSMGTQLDAELIAVLDNIEGFTYTDMHSSLSYTYQKNGNVVEGVIDICTDEFDQLSKKIVDAKPDSFRALLELGLV